MHRKCFLTEVIYRENCNILILLSYWRRIIVSPMLILLKNNDHKKKTRKKKKKLRGKEGANKSIGAHLKKHIYCKLLIKG